MRLVHHAVLVAAIFLSGLPMSAFAAESFDTCTGFVDSLPAVITNSGTWCLRKSLSTTVTSGAAIEVKAADVRLDCHGHRLSGSAGLAGDTTSATGIKTIFTSGIEVEDCTIRGFNLGVNLQGAGHSLRDSRIVQNRLGVYLTNTTNAAGINAPIEAVNNVIVDSDMGLRIYGHVVARGNTIDGFRRVGIQVASSSGSVVEGNLVRNVDAEPGVNSIGIGGSTEFVSIVRNTVVALPGMGIGSTGIQCTSGIAYGNVLSGWPLPITGCADAANHIID